MKLNSHVNIEYNLPISLFLFILIGTPCYQTFNILTGSDIPLVVIVDGHPPDRASRTHSQKIGDTIFPNVTQAIQFVFCNKVGIFKTL